MPDSTGRIKGIAIPHVPWHTAKEHDDLPGILANPRTDEPAVIDADEFTAARNDPRVLTLIQGADAYGASQHWFCKGEGCDRDCHCPKPNLNCRCDTLAYTTDSTVEDVQRVGGLCDESRCEKPCRKCDRDGIAEKGW